MDRHTILFVDHAQAIGGAENSLLLLMEYLDHTLWAPHLACVAGALAERAADQGITTHVISMPRLRRSFRAALDWESVSRELAALTHQISARCLYANTVRAAPYAALGARRGRYPFVWHMRDFWLTEARPRRIWLDTLLKRLLCASASQVIANSSAVHAHLSHCRGIEVVHNGIETAAFDPNLAGAPFRAQFGIPANAPLIGTVGRLRAWKGQDRFLRAARDVLKRRPHARFAVVGGTPFGGADDYVGRLQRLTDELGMTECVAFTGHLQDVRPALAAMDIFVHSGDPEPFGLVNVEAMAMALPVVGFDHGALPEIVEDGLTGILVPPYDEAALASAVGTLIEEPHKAAALGQAARARVERDFDVQLTAASIGQILQRVIET